MEQTTKPAFRRLARRALVPLAAGALLALAPAASAADDRAHDALRPAAAGNHRTFAEDFAGPRLDLGRWRHWWGRAAVRRGGAVLASRAPRRAGETFSSLLTTRHSWNDFTLDVELGALAQLRRGGPPNTWETAWVMLRFTGLHAYYYAILKPNGWELGKKHGSDAQIFLATGNSPALPIGQTARLRIRAVGPRIELVVDGRKVVDYVDPKPLRSGAIGLYEEDAVARFSAVRVRQAGAASGG